MQTRYGHGPAILSQLQDWAVEARATLEDYQTEKETKA